MSNKTQRETETQTSEVTATNFDTLLAQVKGVLPEKAYNNLKAQYTDQEIVLCHTLNDMVAQLVSSLPMLEVLMEVGADIKTESDLGKGTLKRNVAGFTSKDGTLKGEKTLKELTHYMDVAMGECPECGETPCKCKQTEQPGKTKLPKATKKKRACDCGEPGCQN